jgi:hypothetical protein
MSKRYFRLNDDVYIPGRWELDTPMDAQGRKLDDWLFREGKPVAVEGRLRIPIGAGEGTVLDFTEAGIGVPVVSARAASRTRSSSTWSPPWASAWSSPWRWTRP